MQYEKYKVYFMVWNFKNKFQPLKITYKLSRSDFLAICVFIIFSVAASLLWAQQEEAYPQPQGYVNDFAGLVSQQDQHRITSVATEIEQKSTAQIAVVTLKTIHPFDIESYAVNLFEKWGIGQKGKDNGVLLLVALMERKVRIETGYGLEGAIPDAICSQIIQNAIIPKFKEGKYSEGILAASLAIAGLVAKEYNVELTGLSQQLIETYGFKTAPASSLLQFLFILFLFILIFGLRFGLFNYILFATLRSQDRRRYEYWYGPTYGGSMGGFGGFGGGSGGFGGGLSGGGGASGSW